MRSDLSVHDSIYKKGLKLSSALLTDGAHEEVRFELTPVERKVGVR